MNDLESGGMLKKFHVAIFLNKGSQSVLDWLRFKKSTDNTITMNPETRELDFIADESPTTVIDKYKPSLSQPLTMFKDEPDFEFLFNKFFNQAAGENAKTDVLIVFYNQKVGAAYLAWKCNAVLVFDSMNPSESVITVNVNFNGTTEKGTALITNGVPVFTASTTREFLFTVETSFSGSPVSGATVKIDGVEKTTGTDGTVVFTLIDGKKYTVGAWDGAAHEYADVITADDSVTSLDITLA